MEDKEEQKKKKRILLILGIIIVIIIILLLLRGCKKEIAYTITLKNGNIIQTAVTDSEGYCAEPKEPIKDGYTFLGWYVNGEKIDFGEAFTEDTTVEAKWEKKKELMEIEENQKESIKEEEDPLEENKIEEEDTNTKEESTKKNNKSNNPQKNNSSSTTKKENTSESTLVPTPIPTPSPEPIPTPSTPSAIEVSSVSISKSSLTMIVGESNQLTAKINPDNATDKTKKWSSSNSGIITVDGNGNLNAIAPGTATITITAGGKTATCIVTVKEPVTYSIEWKKVEGTAIEQYKLYIKSSENEYVSGTIEITTIAGATFDENVTLSGSDNCYIKSAIQSVRIK